MFNIQVHIVHQKQLHGETISPSQSHTQKKTWLNCGDVHINIVTTVKNID